MAFVPIKRMHVRICTKYFERIHTKYHQENGKWENYKWRISKTVHLNLKHFMHIPHSGFIFFKYENSPFIPQQIQTAGNFHVHRFPSPILTEYHQFPQPQKMLIIKTIYKNTLARSIYTLCFDNEIKTFVSMYEFYG